ncbi:MAG: extracellular solute-binding protein [Chloroflexi bacterium]|nr:extracellular solute-binding protein [Chloroflexota bacterium]
MKSTVVLGITLTLLLAACGGASSGASPAAASPSAAAPAQSGAAPASAAAAGDFQSIVAAANKEGKVTIFGPWPRVEDVQKVQDAFNKRFNTNITLDLNSMDVTTARTRLLTGLNANPGEMDTMVEFSTDMYSDLVKQKALAKVDFPTVFGKDLPGVADAYTTAFPEFQGYYMNFDDSDYVLMYNTKQATLADAPKKISDLADPKFKGKFAADPRGFPFNYLVLSPDWGLDKTTALVKSIAANKPLLKQGGSSIVASVAAGEVPFGIANYSSVAAEQKKGSPLAPIIPDYVPNDPRGITIAANAAHPNAAKLYNAWAVSDAAPLWDQMYQLSRLSESDTTAGKLIKEQNPQAKVVSSNSTADVDSAAKALTTFGDIMRGTS